MSRLPRLLGGLKSFAVFLVFAASVSAQEPPSYSEQILAAGPFDDLSALLDWVDAQDAKPLIAGRQVNPLLPDESEGLLYYALGRDSLVWLQDETGRMVTADAYVVQNLGRSFEQRIEYDRTEMTGVGYGWEDGDVYLYLTQKMPIFWFVVSVLASISLLVWLVVQLRMARTRGHQLETSRRRLADSREAERLRLSRDLHDGPLQDLQFVNMRLNTPGGSSPEASAKEQDDVHATVLQIIGELREITEGLRPSVLSPMGLSAAIRSLVQRHRASGLAVRFVLDLDADESDLPDDHRLALFRIVQESITNALRHASPSVISVRLWRDGKTVALQIQDDGSGMVVPKRLHHLESDGHLGVAGMAERAESIGGTLSLSSSPDGTVIKVRVPFASPVLA